MKYIMLQRQLKDGFVQKLPIIFPTGMVHSDIVIAIGEFFISEYNEKLQIVSAGDIYIKCDAVGGNSTTLKISANPNDVDIINNIDDDQIFFC